MAHAARCGDGVIVLLSQGDPPHPNCGRHHFGPGRRIDLKDRLTVNRFYKSDQARSSPTVTPTTTNLVDHELPIRHTNSLPAEYERTLQAC